MKETTEKAMKRHASEIEEMTARHEHEIDELRINCKHKKVSDWTKSMWATGHYGPSVKTCKNCGLVMETEEWNLEVKDGRG